MGSRNLSMTAEKSSSSPHAVGVQDSGGTDLLHPFSRIPVINNQNPIMHNQWEWVNYNQRKRVPNIFPPFLFSNFVILFIINIPIINNQRHIRIINNQVFFSIIYNRSNQGPIIYYQVLNYLQS
jgi:hypothetical protein